ncbi:glycoside hydrolase family 15 protein [Nakamurella lactea]|uniref:hypothetical protein n=1 Tax=Nakamurella lactea TaxID=459515 RepID=UPI0004203906|nr:hypothetical protein [Nakamurella lactea]
MQTLTRPRLLTALLAGALLMPLGIIPANAAEPVFTGQPEHGTALYRLNATNNAGAQEFVSADDHVSVASAWLESQAAEGSITAEIRTNVADPASTVATATRDIAALGGTGSGWVDFDLDVDVTAGQVYYLTIQAHTPTADRVAWYGTRAAVPGGRSSWNYDLDYWGGWQEYPASITAFFIDPTGAQGCGTPGACYRALPPWLGQAYTAGLFYNGTATAAISPADGWGADYLPGSNVLRLPDGNWRYLPAGATEPVTVRAGDRGAVRQITESWRWLAQGTIPGRTLEQRSVATRALLSMRALLQPNGALAAAWYSIWKYSWPRDTSFAAAAFAATGHSAEAYRILQFNAATQRADGTWEARTTLDGAGPPDGRHWQLDANGWVPWATWQWYQHAPRSHRSTQLAALYPTIRKAADYAAASLDADGLPPASPDYWEIGTSTANIGTAAPLLAGLNASVALARAQRHSDDAERWSAAARKLSDGIANTFAPNGYPRTADNLHGRDSAAAFMAPPFNTAPAGLPAALSDTWDALVRGNGGVVPGNDPDQNWGDATWTPSTSFFALGWAGLGNRKRATETLDWVIDQRNWLGELPEMVTADGHPGSTVPLAWTGSIVLMTLLSLDGKGLAAPPTAGG